MSLPSTVRDLWHKLERDRAAGVSTSRVVRKSARYGFELLSAPLWLRDVDEVGAGVRTLGRPRIENHGRMVIGARTLLRSVNVPVELATEEGAELLIGEDVRLNYGVSVGVRGRVVIGDRARLGPYAMVIDSAYHDVHDRNVRPAPQPITLAPDVWVGAKASVMPGVNVGRASIVGTAAVVTRDVPPFTIVAGVPAKKVGEVDPDRFVSPKVASGD